MGTFDANSLMEELREVFASGRTRSAEWRIKQLKGIRKLVIEKQAEIAEALQQDMQKPPFESFVAEMQNVRQEAKCAITNLSKWMAPEKASISMTAFPAKASIVSEPLGVTLVISAWNYPFPLDPVIGAVAAGNVVVLKPSEVAPATSAALARLLPLYVDSTAIRVVEGGVPEVTALLEQAWDKIFYTGSSRVAKIIMAAAAKHLTPVALELGGKSPCLVDATPNLELVARRIAWGKWPSNSGQACIAPDYVLAEESIVPKLIKTLKDTLKEFYGDDPSASPDLARIINTAQFNRLSGLLNDERTVEKVVYGGQTNEKSLYIAPTVILDPPMDSPIMQEEIFGPMLVVVSVKDMDEAIKIMNSRPKPLALYVFSEDIKMVEKVIQTTSCGGITVNDTLLHVDGKRLDLTFSGTYAAQFTQNTLPFGGVGASGLGAYHGKHSFDTFSHRKPVLYRYLMADLTVRYPPYTSKKQKILQALITGQMVNLILILLGVK